MAAPAKTIKQLVHRSSRNPAPDCLPPDESGTQEAKASTQQPSEIILVVLIFLYLEIGFFELINLIEDFVHGLGIGSPEENPVPDASNLFAGVFLERHIFLRIISVPKTVRV